MNSDLLLQNIATFQERKNSLYEKLGKPMNGVDIPNAQQQIYPRLNIIASFFNSTKSKGIIDILWLFDTINELIEAINVDIKYVYDNFNDNQIEIFSIKLIDYCSQIQAIKISILSSQDSKIKQWEDIITKYQSTLQKIELNADSLDFKDTVTHADKRAIWWKVGIYALSALLIALSIIFLFFNYYDFNPIKEFILIAPTGEKSKDSIQIILCFELLRKVLLRIFILSIVIYVLKFAIKNYNAIMHIRTINEHKANTLNAAIRILHIIDIENDKVRNTILQLAGKEIFSSYKTGYLNKDEKLDITMVEKIIDTVKNGK